MSIPIRQCSFVRAYDDRDGFGLQFKKVLADNFKFGSFSIYPCNCKPPCRTLTDEELEELENWLNK